MKPVRALWKIYYCGLSHEFVRWSDPWRKGFKVSLMCFALCVKFSKSFTSFPSPRKRRKWHLKRTRRMGRSEGDIPGWNRTAPEKEWMKGACPLWALIPRGRIFLISWEIRSCVRWWCGPSGTSYRLLGRWLWQTCIGLQRRVSREFIIIFPATGQGNTYLGWRQWKYKGEVMEIKWQQTR